MRLNGWEQLLTSELASAEDRIWSWGEHDCFMFPARAVAAIIGTDYSDPFSYNSKETAQAILDAHGGHAGLLTHILGFPVSANQARRGDVVLAVIDGEPFAGICAGTYCFFAATRGLLVRDRSAITLTWLID